MAVNQTLTIGIISASSSWRARIRELLSRGQSSSDLVIVWETETFHDAITKLLQLPPEILIIHSSKYGLGLMAFLENTMKRFDDVRKILVGPLPPSSLSLRLLNYSLDGYVNTKRADNSLMSAVFAALTEGCYFDKSFISAISSSAPQQNNDKEPIGEYLTAREREILNLLTDGKSNYQIATMLNISERTARLHIRNICDKLGVDTPLQAVVSFFADRNP